MVGLRKDVMALSATFSALVREQKILGYDENSGLRDNLRGAGNAVERIVEEDVPGDLIETGVWRGGASIFMRGALEAYGDRERTVWVADSFQGLPKPDAQRYPRDEGDPLWRFRELAVPV